MNSKGSADREIVSTRVFDAPQERVFKAFSDPAHLAQWWGPKGFTNTINEFDLRPGGHWRLVMHSPDGVNYDNESVFVDVIKPQRVVFKHLDPVHSFQMTLTFDQQAEKTKFTWRMLFDSPNEDTKVRNIILAANEQNFDRLEAHLSKVI